MEIVLWTLNGMVLVGTLALAIWLWTGGLVTLGAITVVSALIIRLMNMSGWFMWTLAGIFDNIGVVQESMQTIARPLQITDKPGALPIKVDKGEIHFDGINFRYAPVERERSRFGRGEQGADAPPPPSTLVGSLAGPRAAVIESLSLKIKAGEKVGLVGRSGAGKSTLVNLLLRFYDVEGAAS